LPPWVPSVTGLFFAPSDPSLGSSNDTCGRWSREPAWHPHPAQSRKKCSPVASSLLPDLLPMVGLCRVHLLNAHSRSPQENTRDLQHVQNLTISRDENQKRQGPCMVLCDAFQLSVFTGKVGMF
jgi:hypothetical protein